MNLREQLESAPEIPAPPEATEESYTEAVKILGKYFLQELDKWKDFNPKLDWKESNLGSALYDRCKDRLPEILRQGLTGAQVGMAAHLAYQAFIN